MDKKFIIKEGLSYKNIIEEVLNSSYKNFLLEGKIGVGKTTFTTEFVKILNANELDFSSIGVMSPTFSILNEYKLKNLVVLHADFYRVDESSFDLEEILERIDESSYSFIEWHENIPSLVKNIDSLRIIITCSNNNERTVQLLASSSMPL